MKKKAKREEQLSLNRLVGLCKEIPDGQRHSGNWTHRLSDVLAICLLGMIRGFETWEEIWDYAKAKSNEITAIPILFAALDIRGGIVSIDAIGCQRAIAAQIIAQEAHYLLAVKGNQPILLKGRVPW